MTVNGNFLTDFRELGRWGRSAGSVKIRCAINGLGGMLGGVCTEFSTSAVENFAAFETCNFSVARLIDVCDQGLRFAVQKLCTGLPTKTVEKVGAMGLLFGRFLIVLPRSGTVCVNRIASRTWCGLPRVTHRAANKICGQCRGAAY